MSALVSTTEASLHLSSHDMIGLDSPSAARVLGQS